jgi:chemotaxis protein histidine kinase CheA
MVTMTFAPQRPAQRDVAGGELVLRVSGSSRDGQIVRLRSAKCSIGSGRNCTLRLRADGVAPLHCLVLRGPAATVVRRWSADTRLNRQFFADALLSPGDRLGVGPIELEVLEVGTPAARTEPPETNRGADFQAAQESPLATCATDPIEQQRRQWQAEQEESQRRFDQQREQLAAQSAQLDAQSSALAAERVSFGSAQNAWAEQRIAIQTEHDALAEQRRQWQAEQDETQRHLDQQREQLAAESAKLETRCNALEAKRNALAQQRNAFQDERQQWESRQVEPADDDDREKGTGPICRNGPEGASHKLDLSPFPGPPPAAEVESSLPPVAEASGEGEEESLDAYMSRLMQRIRSVDQERGTGPPQSSEPERAAPSAAARADQPSPPQPECPPMPATQRREPALVLPRAATPERSVDLSAMRELANLSAHSAISRHARRTLVSTMYSKLIVAVVALAACGGLFWMWKRLAVWEVTFYAALIALSAAIYWGVHYALLTGRLMVNKSGRVARSSSAGQDAHQAPDQFAGSSVEDGQCETASGNLKSQISNP